MTIPARLKKIISFQHTPVQELAIELWEIIAGLAGGDVVGPGSAVNLDIAVFDGVTGKLIKDGAMTIAQVIAASIAGSGDVVGPAGAVNLDVAVFDGVTGKLIKDGGMTIAQIIAAASGGTVVGPGASTNNDVVVWDGVTGTLVKDTGLLVTDVVKGPASAVSGDLPSFNGVTGKILQDSGKLVADVVTGPASAVSGDLATFNGVTGKIIQDSGKLASDIVTGPASATADDVVSFNGTTGKIVKDSGKAVATLVNTTGSPASGNLAKFSGAATIVNGDLSGDVTTPGTLVATIANAVVTYAKMQNASGEAIICRANSASGVLGEITLALSQLMGRGASGDLAAITLGTNLSMSGATLNATGGGGLVQASKVKLSGGDVTTTSATFVDMTGVTITITTGATRCMIEFTADVFHSSATPQSISIALLIDGASQGGTGGNLGVTSVAVNSGINVSFTFLTDVLSAGSHTFKIQWKTSAATATVQAGSVVPLIFSVIETNLTT